MMRGLILTIMLLASASVFAATTVYTWVDAKGETHYSDQPHPGATKLEVNGAPTFSMASVPHGASIPAPKRFTHTRHAATCSIANPSNQQMLMNVWSLSGHVRLPPNLSAGDQVLLMLDGKILKGAASANGSFHVAHIDRGAHTLAAQVEAPDGQVICQAPAITFYVHQPSRLAPHAANRPRF